MYAATIDTVQYTFQASGSLWQDALVMQDLQTQSLWSQISGECIDGPMLGATLELYSSFHTTFAEFKKSYPNGLVLKKPARGENSSHYSRYFSDPEKLGIFGRIDNFQKLAAKSKVYGLRLGGKDVAIAESLLTTDGWVRVKIADSEVIVTFDSHGQTAVAFALDTAEVPDADKLALNGTSLEIENSDIRWDARTGRTLAGDTPDLESVPLLSAYWFAWASFFPDSEVIQ